VLDERSIRESTCAAWHCYNTEVEGSEEEDLEWKSWRVKFIAAWFLCINLWNSPDLLDTLIENGRDAHVDGGGVLNPPYFEHEPSGELPGDERIRD
jgi:hypothetical protein